MIPESLKNGLFRLRHGFKGYPRMVRGVRFRLDESLRRFKTDGEGEIQSALERHLRPGSLFVDVGANFGLHSLLACHLVGAHGAVIAVEPVPENLRLLRRNLQLNGFTARSEVIPKALVAEPSGDLEMTIEPGLSPAATLSGIPGGKTVRVPTTTLDEVLCREDRLPALVKIDVEGAEHEVLKGAPNLLRRGATLLVEVHRFALPSFHSSPELLREFLEGFGYTETRLSEMKSHQGDYFHALYERRGH
jgi:FkbM family methyltransferase